jgi:anti-sigma factor RsiW
MSAGRPHGSPSGKPAGDGHLGDFLSALLDGEIAASEESVVRSHLHRCTRCQEELDEVASARRLVRSLPEVRPPLGYEQRLLRSGRYRRAGVAALAATAAASIAFLGVASPREEPVAVAPQVPRLVDAHVSSASVSGDLVGNLAPAAVPVTFAP